MADKDIYVFDEATSNIDIESEAIIMENVRAMSREKSVVLISHRLANVVPADNIYCMEDGRVKESGTHASLMRAPAAMRGCIRRRNSWKKGTGK